jgi:trehalose utilization protein
MSEGIRVTVWNEGVHEKRSEKVRKVYPKGMGRQIAQYLRKQPGIGPVRVSELDDPDQGLSDKILNKTDVMTWWGHVAHNKVTEENAERVQKRVLEGMGLIVLHSGHMSKPFRRLMGTSCMLKWREWKGIGEKERLWVVDPAHPIVDGIPEYIELERTEMYGEHFDIPQPDQQVFISWYQGGEVFRSGCCWHRGLGKVFYLSPGHETIPIYYNELILQVICNAIKWAAPTRVKGGIKRDHFEPPLEKFD